MNNRTKNNRLKSVTALAKKRGYIELTPNEETNITIVINKLITTLLYESKRHDWNSRQCVAIRELIIKLNRQFNKQNLKYFEDYLSKQETQHGTFYGSYLSDDSDSEEEQKHKGQSLKVQRLIENEAKKFQDRAQLNKITYQKKTTIKPKPKKKQQPKSESETKTTIYPKGSLKTNGQPASNIFSFNDRQLIHHGTDVKLTTVQRDLNRLNLELTRGANLQTVLSTLMEEAKKNRRTFTQFYVAEYRGVTHLTSKWNQSSRKAHREDKTELNKPQYSASIYKAAGVSLFRDYERAKQTLKEQPELFTDPAETLREILLTFREPKPYKYDDYSFSCLAYALQNIYTQDFHGFHELIRENEELKQLFFNDANPFLSTGDTPYHALKYAYGLKPYKGYEDQRLRPRWQASGRAERPYSGVVYTSLHPLTDFDNDGPLHLISLNRAAEVNLKNELNIIAERESCFPSYLPADRVIHKHTAKYPSFKPEYKTINQHKYGLPPEEFSKFRDGLLNNKPHTTEHKNFKQLLGETLCSYHEVRLIDLAREAAEELGGVLIYRDINGKFSLKPPVDSVNRNTRQITREIKKPIKDKQKKRKNIATGEPHLTGLSTEEDTLSIIDRTDESFDYDPANILTEGNHSMSMPLSLMLNAVKNNRYRALKHFLTLPMFQDVVNEKFNSDELENATLLHLAASNNDITALSILTECHACDLMAQANEQCIDQDRCNFFEKITAAQFALIKGNNEAAKFLMKHDRYDINATCSIVYNKDLLSGDMLITSEEVGEGEDFIGYAFHRRESVPIIRVHGQTWLHLAVVFDNMLMFNDILKYHRRKFLNLGDEEGITPISVALEKNNDLMIKALIKAGANLKPHEQEQVDKILPRKPSASKQGPRR